ncbi:hypothetical protein [Nocardia farcinica]|uniref:hypothetical protein n=1 Tax=Nocardia farcinica TaxID=37329 RepID=UPI0024580FD7|nr:hypothetical protein [Nocardia farcinica]
MVYQPPSGIEDLASQTNDLEQEREALAAERAMFEQLRQEAALVRQRRQQVTAPIGPVVGGDALTEPAASTELGPVIDPTGQAYELDKDGQPVRDSNGDPIPAGEYDRDDDGVVVLDSDGNPAPVWRHGTIELHGMTIQARKPQPAALQAFSMAVSKHTPAKTQTDMVTLFVRMHISDRSYGDLLAAMMNPDTAIDIKIFGELMSKIATMGTSRPTLPSRP